MFRDYKIFYQKSIGLLLTETLISMAFILFIETVPLLAKVLSGDSMESMLADPENFKLAKFLVCVGAVSVTAVLFMYQTTLSAGPYGLKLYSTVPYGAEKQARAILCSNFIYFAAAVIYGALCIMPMAVTGLFFGQVCISAVYSVSALMTVAGIFTCIKNMILSCDIDNTKRAVYFCFLLVLSYGLAVVSVVPVFVTEYTAGVSGSLAVVMTAAMAVSQLGGGYISGRFAAKRWNMH